MVCNEVSKFLPPTSKTNGTCAIELMKDDRQNGQNLTRTIKKRQHQNHAPGARHLAVGGGQVLARPLRHARFRASRPAEPPRRLRPLSTFLVKFVKTLWILKV
jgi:hypothetical protein